MSVRSNRWRIAGRIKFGSEHVITAFHFEEAIAWRYGRFYARKSPNHTLLTECNHRLRNSGSRFTLSAVFHRAITLGSYLLGLPDRRFFATPSFNRAIRSFLPCVSNILLILLGSWRKMSLNFARGNAKPSIVWTTVSKLLIKTSAHDLIFVA